MTSLPQIILLALWLIYVSPSVSAVSLGGNWVATGHGGINVTLSQENDVLRLNYIRTAPGYIMLKRSQTFDLPGRYLIRLDVRSEAPQADLELRLPDPLANNVWSWKQFGFRWPSKWQALRIPSRAIEFAWGPSPSPFSQAGAVELFITPTGGERGLIELKDLLLEPLPPLSGTEKPRIDSQDSAPGHTPASLLDDSHNKSWKSRGGFSHPTLTLDFGGNHAIGGIILDWCNENTVKDFQVDTSVHRGDWHLLRTVSNSPSKQNILYLPDTEVHHLRLSIDTQSADKSACLERMRLIPAAQSAPNAFFETLAKQSPKGDYPPFYLGQQSFYTVVGAPNSEHEGLLNQQGILETGRGQFTIESFLYANNRLITWHDVHPQQSLEDGYLPVPITRWRHDGIEFSTSAFAVPSDPSTLYARYKVTNVGNTPQQAKLFLALRPFQVNPPWQSLNMNGGFTEIRLIRQRDDHAILVNEQQTIIPLTPGGRFGAAPLIQGNLIDTLRAGDIPATGDARDDSGLVQGVISYELNLAPHASREFFIAIPADSKKSVQIPVVPSPDTDRLQQALAEWKKILQGPVLSGPAQAQSLFDTARTNLGYILIHRDAPAFYPGSRAYARSWIRDSALISSALLEMGKRDEVREFIRWYAGFQLSDGQIPCCLDPRGAEVVPEHDSHGEFIHILTEYYRYTHDTALVRELWPAIVRTVAAIDHLRQQRMTEEYRSGSKSAFYGLMPESISHEGYSGRPVHAFWDDFWTLRGLKDAEILAEVMGSQKDVQKFSTLRNSLHQDMKSAVSRTMADKKLTYIPSSVELGDFDVNSTAIAINLGINDDLLPVGPLSRTFDDYRKHFEKRLHGTVKWDAYTPYEVRSVEALVKLGRRQQALDLLNFLMQGQRPQGWNQWPEIVWREALAPRFFGDSPHAWIGAEFIRAVRTLYAYERESDQSLILAAGIPEEWLKKGSKAGVQNLPTWYGNLDYSIQRKSGKEFQITLGGDFQMPSGKVIIKAPSIHPLREVVVNGKTVKPQSDQEAIVSEAPADVILRY